MDISRGQFAYVEGVLSRTLKTGEASAYNTYNTYRLLGVGDVTAHHTQLRGNLTFFLGNTIVSKEAYSDYLCLCNPVECLPVATTVVGLRRLSKDYRSVSHSSVVIADLQRLFYENKGVVLGFGVGYGGNSFEVAALPPLETVERLHPTTRKLVYMHWLKEHGFNTSRKLDALPPSFPTFIEVRDMAAKDFVNRLKMLEKTLTKENL